MTERRSQFNSGGVVEPTITDLSKFHSKKRECVMIRELTGPGMFRRATHCPFGKITILTPALARALNQSTDDRKLVDVRIGSTELSRTQIAFSEDFKWKWTENSVIRVVESFRLKSEEVADLLEKAALRSAATKQPKELTSDEARRLSVLCCLFSTSRVICLEDPFQGLGTEQEERFAELILSKVARLQHVWLLTTESIPKCWKEDPAVKTARKSNSAFTRLLFRWKKKPFELGELRPQSEERAKAEPVIITYPQSVLGKPAKRDVITTESIHNPNQLSAITASNDSTVNVSTPLLPKRKRSLTRVTLIMRIVRRSAVIDLGNRIQVFFQRRWLGRLQQASLPPENRLEVSRQAKQYHVLLTLLLLLVVSALIFFLL